MQQDPQPQKVKMALVAVGGNATSVAGNALSTVQAGLAALAEKFDDVNVSNLYQTPAFPAGSGADFVNCVAVFQTNLTPREILDVLHGIENSFGRSRAQRWGARTLDLDLIGFGSDVLPDLDTYNLWRTLPPESQKTQTPDVLLLPHPRVQDRPFVLVPLADIAPDWVHPVLGLTVIEMINAFPPQDLAQIRPI